MALSHVLSRLKGVPMAGMPTAARGALAPGSEGSNEAPVGCRVHLDVTPKDASNKPTQAKHTPEWSFSNMGIIVIGDTSGFNPSFVAKAPGTVTAYAEADGVRSNDV